MSSESKPDHSVKPQHEIDLLKPHASPLKPQDGSGQCTEARTLGGSDPCGGSGGKADGKGV
jgi:hypothetical protein